MDTILLSSTATSHTQVEPHHESTTSSVNFVLEVESEKNNQTTATSLWHLLRDSRSHLTNPVIQPVNKLITQGEMADDPSYDPNQVRVIDIIVFTFLFAIAAPANFKIIKCLIWTQNSTKLYKKSRHHFLLLNLAIADAIVLFIMIPAEVGWRVTASWKAGNIGCKIFGFVRVFGLYASSMILICISIDRYYAVVQPFKYGSAATRISRLLKASWLLSVILSIPQVNTNPVEPVAFGYFLSYLLAIRFLYTRILPVHLFHVCITFTLLRIRILALFITRLPLLLFSRESCVYHLERTLAVTCDLQLTTNTTLSLSLSRGTSSAPCKVN